MARRIPGRIAIALGSFSHRARLSEHIARPPSRHVSTPALAIEEASIELAATMEMESEDETLRSLAAGNSMD